MASDTWKWVIWWAKSGRGHATWKQIEGETLLGRHLKGELCCGNNLAGRQIEEERPAEQGHFCRLSAGGRHLFGDTLQGTGIRGHSAWGQV